MGQSERSALPEIVIPLPPIGCQPHAKGHWRPKAAATKLHREEARMYGIASNLRLSGMVRIHHDWYMGKTKAELFTGGRSDRRYHPLDIGNAIAALKAAIDGLVDAGVLPGDTHKQVQWGECRLLRTAKAHGGRSGVVLRFEALEGIPTPPNESYGGEVAVFQPVREGF